MEKDNVKPVLKRGFYKMLECPICFQYMESPIFQCIEGHSICNSCKQKIKDCPVCKQSLSSKRNFIAEHVSESMTYPCENSEQGCKSMFFLKELGRHEKHCAYRLYHCARDACAWHGMRKEILTHFQKKHVEWIWNGPKLNVVLQWQTFIYESRIVTAFDEIFWFKSGFDQTDKSFNLSVHFIGPEDMCRKYYYEVSFVSKFDPGHKIVFRGHVHPDHIELKELAKDGICASLSNSKGKCFVDNKNTVEYSLEIIQNKDSLFTFGMY